MVSSRIFDCGSNGSPQLLKGFQCLVSKVSSMRGGSSGILLEHSCVSLGNFPGCVAAKFIPWFPGRSRRQTNMILKSPF